MANRKTKLDYIQLPSDHLIQRDVRKMLRIFNTKHPGFAAIAYSVLISLYATMARDSAGYYLEYDEDLVADLANELCLDENLIRESIATAVEAGVLNRQLFDERLLSSAEYQIMYFTVVSKLGRIIDLTSMPFILIDSNDFQGKEIRRRETYGNPKERTDSSREYQHSSVESQRTNIECTESPVVCTDSSKGNTDSSRSGQSNVRYENGKEKGKIISAQARQGPPFFDFNILNEKFCDLLKQPMWSNKTPEAIKVAVEILKDYPPFVAIEVIDHTILTGIRDLDPPTSAMIEKAQGKRKDFDKVNINVSEAQNSPEPQPISFCMESNSGEHVPKAANEIRNAMALVMKDANETIKGQLFEVKFELFGNQLSIQASKEAIEWLRGYDIPEFAKYEIELLPNDE